MVIGTDFHGVIFEKQVAQAIKRMYGLEIPESYYAKEIEDAKEALTEEQYRKMRLAFHGNPIGSMMKPIKDVAAYFPFLQADHQVHVVSSRDNVGLYIARWCCEKYGLEFDITGVGRSVVDKSEAISTLNLDVYVDDELKKLVPLIGIVENLFWLTQTSGHCPDEITRVTNWQELDYAIRSI